MTLQSFEPGIALDRVTMRGVPAAQATVTDYFTGDPVDVFSTTDDTTPIALTTNRYGYFDEFRADAVVVRVKFGTVILTRTAVNLAIVFMQSQIDTLFDANADLTARVEALEAGVDPGEPGSLVITDNGAGVLSTTSTLVVDNGAGVLSTTSTAVTDNGTGTLSAA